MRMPGLTNINLTENLIICKNMGSKVQKAKIWILENLIIYKWRFEDILYGFPYIAAHQQRAWKLRQRLEEFHLMVQNLRHVQCTLYIDAVSASCWLSYKGKRCDTDIGLGGQPGNGQGTSKLCSSRRENLVALSQGVQFFWFLSIFLFYWTIFFKYDAVYSFHQIHYCTKVDCGNKRAGVRSEDAQAVKIVEFIHQHPK